MGFVNKYPYVDFHELNADALIAKVDDASAEAKAAAETVATYNDRLTTVEGDLAPIKSAMPGIASDISDLRHDTGIIDSLITNTINPAIDTLQNEVEAPSTGLLDRVTALENQPAVGGITEYLRFGTGGTPIDWDARIDYTYLDDLIATTASADKTVNIVLVEDDELGTTWYYTLNEGEYQISAGTPRGQFTFVCRKPVLDGNNVVTCYKTCTVTVNKNAATPTYAEVQEDVVTGVENGSITYSHANITATAYWERINNVVTVNTLFHADYNGLTGTLFTLPYVPKAGFGTFFRCSGSNADLQTWVSGTTGDVSISTTTDAGNNYGTSFSYIKA